mmetsp:Transcript_32833/g.55371  ORF Transcript_32833/g.55371 Transcript_32833/m.55371 type:complete len:282 (+) Transcript_32833:267-1112(+)
MRLEATPVPAKDDDSDEMPLAVALVRVLSVAILLLGLSQSVMSGIVLYTSGGENILGIYFAATSTICGMWGIYLAEGHAQFNLLVLFLIINLVCAIVGIVYASISIYVLNRVEACADFDPLGSTLPRCQATAINATTGAVYSNVTSFGNFTCTGEADYFVLAAQCETRYIVEEGASEGGDRCGCVYRDNGSHCKEFPGYGSCDTMLDTLPDIAYGTYILGYFCFGLTFILLIAACTASCQHVNKRSFFAGMTSPVGGAPGMLMMSPVKRGQVSPTRVAVVP